MIFGLPWFAVVAIVSIVVAVGGGIWSDIRSKELKLEEKRLTSSKESHELRKMIFNLKSRIEHLERIVNEMEQPKSDISLDEIEIKSDINNESKNSKLRG
jgi:signal transduction histidine kinase